MIVWKAAARHTARILALTMGAALVAAPARAQETPAIAGAWKLNVEASTNPNGPPPPARTTAPRGGRGGGGISTGAGDISGGSVSSASGGELGQEEMARFNGVKNLLMQAPPMMGIQATATDVIIIYDPQKGPRFDHKTDNKAKDFATPFGPMAMKVKWDKAKLKRETETRETLRVVEEFTLSADGKQLFVTVKADSRMVRNVQAGDVKRVYDRQQ